MKKIILIQCAFALLLAVGCNPNVWRAASSALDETLGRAQQRYGDSKFYEENGGKEIDELSGYERIPGKAHYYNKTGRTITIELIGDLQPNSSTTEIWSANFCGSIIDKKSGNEMYDVCHGPEFTNRIIIFYVDDFEVR